MTALKYYDVASGTWKIIGSTQGPVGPQGPQGIQGVPGPPTLEVYVGTTIPSPRGDYTVMVDTDDPDPTPEAWHLIGGSGEPAFATGWSNYSLTNFQAAGFFKDFSGVVHLKGLVKKSSAVVAADPIFTLPAGYRPGAGANGGSYLFVTISNSALGRVDVLTTGVVAVQIGNAGWISLDNISFRAEA
jgi:hypothetical protein